MIRAGLGGRRERAGIALKSRVDLLRNWELMVPIWRVLWPAEVADSIHITNKAGSRRSLVIRDALDGRLHRVGIQVHSLHVVSISVDNTPDGR